MNKTILNISNEEFNALLHDTHNASRKQLEGSKKAELMPTLIVYGVKKEGEKQKATIIIFTSFDEDDKDSLLFEVGERFAKEGRHEPTAIFLTSEAFGAFFDETKKEQLRPSQNPNRIEALITVGLAIDGRTNMAIAKITRAGTKKATILDKSEFIKYKDKPIANPFLLRNFYAGFLFTRTTRGVDKLKKDTRN